MSRIRRLRSALAVSLVCLVVLSCSKDHPKHFSYHGADFVFDDVSSTSVTVDTVLREIGAGDYRLDELKFENGDVIVDVGANVGVISIILAKMNPGVKIYAFEPVPRTYAALMRNIAANKVTNITAVNKALTADGKTITINAEFDVNPGGASSFGRQQAGAGKEKVSHLLVESTTLDEVFRSNGIEQCRLLKIDCEGCEYGVLMNTSVLGKIENIKGEFHDYPSTSARGLTSEGLRRFILMKNPSIRLQIVTYTEPRQ